MTALNKQFKQLKLIPVIAINDAEQAVPLAKVLIENGLPVAEIAFRTPAAAQAVRNMREAYPSLLIGAGTVVNRQQVDQAIAAGVDFIVSPGFNPSTVQYCLDQKVAIIPGVNSPSLVEQAMQMGLDILKFFPAELSGGVAMLKALSPIYPVSFIPTGGMTAANVKSYLDVDTVLACGGTWMVPSQLIEQGEWDKIGKLIREAVAALA
jgi:2-dehydro-3-deoxyphosphogluconate aldolase/(4S)-4-hydroxy-2-oxoglutarate aldolase